MDFTNRGAEIVGKFTSLLDDALPNSKNSSPPTAIDKIVKQHVVHLAEEGFAIYGAWYPLLSKQRSNVVLVNPLQGAFPSMDQRAAPDVMGSPGTTSRSPAT